LSIVLTSYVASPEKTDTRLSPPKSAVFVLNGSHRPIQTQLLSILENWLRNPAAGDKFFKESIVRQALFVCDKCSKKDGGKVAWGSENIFL